MKPENTIQGKEITREQALEGLGDPSTWEEEHKKLYDEFRAKPPVMKNKLILMVGCSGSGKTFYCENYFKNDLYSVYLSSDSLRAVIGTDEGDQSVSGEVFKTLEYMTEYFLKNGKIVVCDMTNYRPKNRKPFIDIARKLNIPITAICFKTPIEVCKERNRQRGRQVGEEIIDRQFAGLVWPKYPEVDEVVDVFPELNS